MASRVGVEPTFLGEALLQAIGNTEICVFVYYPDQGRIEVPKNTCDKYHCRSEYENMPASFADDFVHDDDREAFFELYRKIDDGEKTATATFHSKDMSICCKVTLTEIVSSGASTPNRVAQREVVGVIEDVSDRDRDRQLIDFIQDKLTEIDSADDDLVEARDVISETIGGQYHAIYYLWLEDKTFVCYRSDFLDEISAFGKRVDCVKAWKAYVENEIEPEDKSRVGEFSDIDSLGDRLKEQKTVSLEYRLRGVGWVRGQFYASKYDEDGNVANAIFTVADITLEKTAEMARRQAVYESQHDALTGAFNRAAFDKRMSPSPLDNGPVGFAIMDIDRFKEINDEYGHEVGDSVIADVAKAISSTFRGDDELYRIGGDEFVVILSDADESSWRAVCKKLARIHSEFVDSSSNGIEITMSAGVCFSPSGVREWMYHAADEALFHVKRNGRAGFALADASGKILDSWKDLDASENMMAALAGSSAAIARIEKSLDKSHAPRLIGGDAIGNIYGFPQGATPEECYEIWARGIDEADHAVLNEAAEMMMDSDNVECAFHWSNGESEPFLVRMVGAGHMEGSTVVIYSLHRSLEGAIIIDNDDSRQIIEAQSATYVSSVYVDLASNSYRMIKGSEELKKNLVPEDNAVEGTRVFVSRLVHPDYRAKMANFAELSTVSERIGNQSSIDCEYLSLTGRGWCRATWVPVKRDERGVVTHVLFMVATIDKAKQLEIQRELETARLMTLHFDAAETLLNTRILAIALLEKSRCEGSMWTNSTGFSQAEDARMIELAHRDAQSIPENKRAEFIAAMDPATVVEHVESSGRYSVSAENILDDGSVRYLEYHFAEYDKDSRVLLSVVEDVTAIYEENGRSIDDFFDNVPGGLITFELDGESFNLLHVSNYCEKLFGLGASMSAGASVFAFLENVHPDDLASLREAIHRAHMESLELHHVYRIWNPDQNRYIWIKVDSYAKEYPGGRYYVYAMFSDITTQKEAELQLEQTFEDRMRSLLQSNSDAKRVSVFNLSKRLAKHIEEGDFGAITQEDMFDYTTVLEQFSKGFVRESEQEECVSVFSVENLTSSAKSGVLKVNMEGLYEFEAGETEWSEVTAEMAVNPLTGELEGVAYVSNINPLKLATLLVKLGMSNDYAMVSVLLGEGDEYFLYDRATGSSCEHRTDFWGTCDSLLKFLCTDAEYARISALMDKEAILESVENGEEQDISFTINVEDSDRRCSLRFIPVAEEPGLVVAALRDVTDEEMDAKLRRAMSHDALTGLYRRETFFNACENLLSDNPQSQFYMTVLNVRRFRLFNASYGEEEGNNLLIAIADAIRSVCGAYEQVAYGRIEADIFGIMFATEGEEIPTDQIHLIEKFFSEYSREFMLEPSVGIYEVCDREMPIASMLTRATAAAKEGAGKTGFVCVYSDAMERKLDEELLVANDMRLALSNRQFGVYLQPKYDLQTGELVGSEALVRWVHPDRGVMAPGKFINVFENNGSISKLDHYMLEAVCGVLSDWVKSGRDPKPVSVNISRVSALNKGTVPFLKELVERYEIDPSLLEIELTESAYIEDPEEIKRTLSELQSLGFKILMDDFGSGYSSLNTLRELPVDVLKLDMGFLSDSCNDPRGRAVLSATMSMTKGLGLPVIAEGVETEEQADYLSSLGCEYAQGYLYAKPMPVDDFEAVEDKGAGK